MLVSLIKYLIDPFNILWILAFLSVVSWYVKKKRFTKWFTILACIWFLLISTPLLPNMVLNSLEDQYKPLYVSDLKDKDAEFHVVVLGAGHGFDRNMPANTLLSQKALFRLNEGIRLHRKLPNSKLVLSGYSSVGNITGAEMLQKTALILGVEEESILLQKEPVNTYEESKVYAEKFGNTSRTILVTSAAHMPRAMMMFERQGIDPIPSPTNFRLMGSRKERIFSLPEMSNIENLGLGINEYAGILYFSLFY